MMRAFSFILFASTDTRSIWFFSSSVLILSSHFVLCSPVAFSRQIERKRVCFKHFCGSIWLRCHRLKPTTDDIIRINSSWTRSTPKHTQARSCRLAHNQEHKWEKNKNNVKIKCKGETRKKKSKWKKTASTIESRPHIIISINDPSTAFLLSKLNETKKKPFRVRELSDENENGSASTYRHFCPTLFTGKRESFSLDLFHYVLHKFKIKIKWKKISPWIEVAINFMPFFSLVIRKVW